VLREKVRASLADPRPSVPAREVFERLRARKAKGTKRSSREI
jgi:antitoxin ParD1/3/4